ncbi:MAG TPA: DUF1887 family CARF protein [Acetobacteraceae bacterium]|nr:DUF1887 family CARF protein [Acetobacteraceae bacterium]
MSATQPAWPEQFVYVCSASNAAVVNMLPIVHAGLNRVRGVVVFCGADPGKPSGDEVAQAVRPARDLQAIMDELTSGGITEAAGNFRTLYGDSGDIAQWRANMGRVFTEFSRPDGSEHPVVFNIKGGTKEMALGGIIGRADDGRFILVTVRGVPLRVEQVLRDGQVALPAEGRLLTLKQHLRIYGYMEHQATSPDLPRPELEAWYLGNEERIRGFAEAVLPIAPRTAGFLNDKGKDCLPGKNERDFVRQEFGVPRRLAAAFDALDGFDGFTITRDATGLPVSVAVENRHAAKFLNGNWLEAHLFLEIRRAVGGCAGVEIAANLGICEPGKLRAAEFDVAILVRGQLHLIEAKTGEMYSAVGQQGAERSFSQLDSMKRALLGQVGKALIVNPRMTTAGGVLDRALRGGEELFLGPDAVTDAMARIVQLVEGG